jgi:hypothetical protein
MLSMDGQIAAVLAMQNRQKNMYCLQTIINKKTYGN